MTPLLDTGCQVGGVTVLWYQSQGLSSYGIDYMIEKMCLVMCWPDVDVFVFCIDGLSSECS